MLLSRRLRSGFRLKRRNCFKNMAFVYIIKSLTSGKYYIGSTSDINRRFKQHINGHTHTTKRFGELELVFSQKYTDLKDARIIERKLKKLKRKDYIEKIIKDGFIRIASETKAPR